MTHSHLKHYLSAELTVAKMHTLYLEKYETDTFQQMKSGVDVKPIVSYNFYREYFNSKFNLSFGKPHKDTCVTCDEMQIRIDGTQEPDRKQSLQKELADYKRKAQVFYSTLNSETEIAKSNDSTRVLTFDYMQNLPLPHIPVGEVYYCTQLWYFTFGIHSCTEGTASMYCYPEMLAKKSPSEVVSMLDHYLKTLPSQVTTLHLYSDACPGQNRNTTVMQYLLSLVYLDRFQYIRHTFPIRGHSYMPNDRDFGKIKSVKEKTERVYSPNGWLEVIRSARKKPPFEVIEVDQLMIYDFAGHLAPFFKKAPTTRLRQKLMISKVYILEYSNHHKDEVWAKYALSDSEPWFKFAIRKTRGPRITFPTLPKFSQPLPVKPSKVKDAESLATKYVPEDFRQFYLGLASTEDVDSESDSD